MAQKYYEAVKHSGRMFEICEVEVMVYLNGCSQKDNNRNIIT